MRETGGVCCPVACTCCRKQVAGSKLGLLIRYMLELVGGKLLTQEHARKQAHILTRMRAQAQARR